jgi:uncharacterized protein
MQVDIRAKDKHDRAPVNFRRELDLSELFRFGEKLFPQAVVISGSAAFTGDYYDISYTAQGILHTACSRCLKDMQTPFSKSFRHIAMEADDNRSPWSETITLHDGMLDVAEMASGDLLLEMEGVALCREDCPGLLHLCPAESPDPRFDPLRAFMRDGQIIDNDDESIR